jgi:hypothetical protein
MKLPRVFYFEKQRRATMRKEMLSLTLLLAVGAAIPAAANESPVAPWELDSFIGKSIKGSGFMPLGIVGAADTRDGLIQVVGPQGQVATLHTSMLVSTGSCSLRAPSLT